MSSGIQQVIPLSLFFIFYSCMVQFYEELVTRKALGIKCGQLANKPLNRNTKSTFGFFCSDEDDDDDSNDIETDDQKLILNQNLMQTVMQILKIA